MSATDRGFDGTQRAGSSGAAHGQLPASEVAAFCEGLAGMLAAGIQLDEGLALLGESAGGTPLAAACAQLYGSVAAGGALSAAMSDAGCFPTHAVAMVGMGERAGRTERVLRSLAAYYGEEARVMSKVRTAVGYPAALLCVMSVILAFTVAVILPTFVSAYEGMAGTLTAGSSFAVGASIVVGWVALAVCLVGAASALAGVIASGTVRGQGALVRVMERARVTRRAMDQLALSRFLGALATCLAAGSNADAAMEEALAGVDNRALRERLEPALRAMTNAEQGLGLAQAIASSGALEPVHARMLALGMRTGSADAVLAQLSESFFDDAVARVDGVIDAVEPALAAFLTVAVGATLVSVMLPLIGMMGAVG